MEGDSRKNGRVGDGEIKEYELKMVREERKQLKRQISRFAVVIEDESNKAADQSEPFHPIFAGIYNRNYSDVAETLTEMHSNEINTIRYTGQFPLHAACVAGDLEILRILLEKGAKVTVTNCWGITPLHVGVNENWFEGVKLLIEHQAPLDMLTEKPQTVRELREETPFQLAIRKGNLKILQLMMLQDPNPEISDSEQNTALHLAAESQSYDVLNLVRKNPRSKKNCGLKNIFGNTPLHSLLKQASLSSSYEDLIRCAVLLLETGAELDCQNNLGETPLYIACKVGLPPIVELLLRSGASPTISTHCQESCIHAACESGSPECLSLILETKHTDHLVLKKDSYGKAPFHKAVYSSSFECCAILLENGDHLSIKDDNGLTRWSLIMENIPNSVQLMKRLFDHNIQASSTNIFDSSLKVTIDYQMLLYNEKDSNSQRTLIEELDLRKFAELLKHPLVESFLYIKWTSIKPFFYVSVALYAAFILLHTSFVMLFINKDRQKNDLEANRLFQSFVFLYVIFFMLIFISDIIIIFANFKKYLKQLETYIKFLSILTAAAFVAIQKRQHSEIPQRNLASISLFFGWVELMLLLGRFPTFGSYILMFTKVAASMVKFCFCFSFLLMGFSCAFRILFNEVNEFVSLPLTIVKTTMMMIGEIEYENIFTQSNLTDSFALSSHESSFHIYVNDSLKLGFLIAFLFLVPILMANLLIGLAVNDIPELRRIGQIERLSKQASYLVSYEKTLLSMQSSCFCPSFLREYLAKKTRINPEISFYPNKKEATGKNFSKIPSKILKDAISLAMNETNCLRNSGPHAERGFQNFEGKDLLALHQAQFHESLKFYTQRMRSILTLYCKNSICTEKFNYFTKQILDQSKDLKNSYGNYIHGRNRQESIFTNIGTIRMPVSRNTSVP